MNGIDVLIGLDESLWNIIHGKTISIFSIPYSIFHIPYSIFHIPYSIFHIPLSFEYPYLSKIENNLNIIVGI
jgi:hypothetical protein